MPYYKNPKKFDDYQKKRMAVALEAAKYFPIKYIDQYGKAHHSRSTKDPADILRVFNKYKFTNAGIETGLNSLTGISCNPPQRRRLVEALDLPKHQEVVARVRDQQIMLFKHPANVLIPHNVTLAKNMTLLKDGTIIPLHGSKLVDPHHGYSDTELWGNIRDIPDFPQALLDELEIETVENKQAK